MHRDAHRPKPALLLSIVYHWYKNKMYLRYRYGMFDGDLAEPIKATEVTIAQEAHLSMN